MLAVAGLAMLAVPFVIVGVIIHAIATVGDEPNQTPTRVEILSPAVDTCVELGWGDRAWCEDLTMQMDQDINEELNGR